MKVSVDFSVIGINIDVFSNIIDLIKQGVFKKGRIRLIVDVSISELERRQTVIEGLWDKFVSSVGGILLKDAEMYDEVYTRSINKGKYTVEGMTPEFSPKPKRINVQKKDKMFVLAQSIKWIEFPL